jgi:hypothetical protein
MCPQAGLGREEGSRLGGAGWGRTNEGVESVVGMGMGCAMADLAGSNDRLPSSSSSS